VLDVLLRLPKFEPGRAGADKSLFPSFVITCVRRALFDAVRRAGPAVHVPRNTWKKVSKARKAAVEEGLDLVEAFTRFGLHPSDVVLFTHRHGAWEASPDVSIPEPEKNVLAEEALEALQALPERERAAVAQSVDLSPEPTLAALGKRFGLSRDTMTKAKARGLEQLRKFLAA
jgi:DNA-directed RNA polymerase specialized sigma24 family protein